MTEIKRFYDKIQFPGPYSKESLDYHNPIIRNPYLKIINSVLKDEQSVIDIGCGTGLITNLFAKKYPSSTFYALDFSKSIEHAKQIGFEIGLTNVQYIKKDFVNFVPDCQYDVVICQGVLHHIPAYQQLIHKLQNIVAKDGYLVMGLYHPWGKIIKKYFSIDYNNEVLYLDQEHNPFETSFSQREVCNLFTEFNLKKSYPSLLGNVALPSLFNYKNGGLVTYVLQKN